MFQKLSIKMYLLVVFSSIILLSTVSTIVSFVSLSQLDSQMDTLTQEALVADSEIMSARITVLLAARNVREMIFAPASDYDAYEKEVIANAATINSHIANLKAIYGQSDVLVGNYEKAVSDWLVVATNIMNLIQTKDNDNLLLAADMVLNQCAPALDQMVDLARDISVRTEELKNETVTMSEETILYSRILAAGVFALVTIASLIFAANCTQNITSIVSRIKQFAEELYKGNLDINIGYDAHNEFGSLTNSLDKSIHELHVYVAEIERCMTAFSKGDFTTNIDKEFDGDFQRIKTSINTFKDRISDALIRISDATFTVSQSADQVSQSSQIIAQSAVEQASGIQEISATVSDVSDQVSNSSKFAEEVNETSRRTSELVESSIDEMGQMLVAVENIATSSVDIQRIIKVIEDIAFQTNILALNAAVEAARAGNSGKGFAVVADEVRSLAKKSSEAAQETNTIIQKSLSFVGEGEKLAKNTNEAFSQVAVQSGTVMDMVDNISKESKKQSAALSEISTGIEHISSAVQMSSATSEKSASTSESLNEQVSIMKRLLSQFNLRK